MELTTKGRYAVMALSDLARHSAGGAVALSAISERQRISLPYLEQIFQRLRRAGLVESMRGRAGGYALARPASTLPIAEIMRAVEEPTRMTRCESEALGCLGEDRCLTHDLWSALGAHIAEFLERVTLQDVVDGMPGHARGPGAVDAAEWARRFGLPPESMAAE